MIEAVLASGNGVAIRFLNRELDPLWGQSLRFALAASLMLLVALASRPPFPRGRALAGAVLFGVFQFAGAFGFYSWSLLEIQAGLGQTLLALVPLATIGLAVAQRQERVRFATLIGALIGLFGVALLSADQLNGDVSVGSLWAVLASILCFAQALVIVRRFPSTHPVALNTVGIGVSVPALLGAAVIAEESMTIPQRPESWVALIYVAAVGSVVVFLLHIYVAQHWGASRTAYVMVVVPFFTVALSAWLDGERISTRLVAGGLLVIIGVWVGALRQLNGSRA